MNLTHNGDVLSAQSYVFMSYFQNCWTDVYEIWNWEHTLEGTWWILFGCLLLWFMWSSKTSRKSLFLYRKFVH